MKPVSFCPGSILVLVLFSLSYGQDPNHDMSKLNLPDPLIAEDGTRIESSQSWLSNRRPEVLQLFADNVYGNLPKTDFAVEHRVVNEWDVLDGSAKCREVDFTFSKGGKKVLAKMLLFIPNQSLPVGCFLGYNFGGNHTVSDDSRISLPTSWVPAKKELPNVATEQQRGKAKSRWPVEAILKNGFALATVYCGDIDPDFDDQFKNGIHQLLDETPSKNDWGTIATWVWGLSRFADYLEADPSINGEQLSVIGHSRLGKTALWAGATDPRFQIVISNNSGCGGAALSRRRHGETVGRINKVFPHWFCDQFCEYNDKEDECPVDQHELIALIAPRSVYVASATKDDWADPLGEYQSLVHASPVFELFDNPPVKETVPQPDTPVRFGSIGYHIRTGKHNITLYDWEKYLEFANTTFGRR